MSLNLALKINCLIGESPLWNPLDSSIYFVDIKKPSINKLCVINNKYETITAPSEIGCIAFKKGGGLVAAMKSGLALVDFSSPHYSFFSSIDSDLVNNRPNDGRCDKAGRLWIASMDNNEINPSGRLWCIQHSTASKVWDSNFIIGNGIDWSPNSQKMYFTDSVNRTIYVYDFNLAYGAIKNKKIFAKIPDSDGFPDGLTVDSQGFVWSAHWDGWRITRYTPDGTIDLVVPLPVPRPTSLTFGGNNLKSIFITSASYGLSSDDLIKAPLSGSLFIFESHVSGQSCNLYSHI